MGVKYLSAASPSFSLTISFPAAEKVRALLEHRRLQCKIDLQAFALLRHRRHLVGAAVYEKTGEHKGLRPAGSWQLARSIPHQPGHGFIGPRLDLVLILNHAAPH